MTDWIGAAIEATGTVAAGAIGAWVLRRHYQATEARKKDELEQRKREFEWERTRDIARGAAWVVDRIVKSNVIEGSDEEDGEDYKDPKESGWW